MGGAAIKEIDPSTTALGAVLVLIAPMSAPEIEVHLVEIVALDRVFEIGVADLLNAAAYNGLELLQPHGRSPAVVSVRRFDNLDIPSDHVNQILLSPCPDQQSGRVVFVSDDTQKSVIEAEPHSTIVSNFPDAASPQYQSARPHGVKRGEERASGLLCALSASLDFGHDGRQT
jgi:hypothetical protein